MATKKLTLINGGRDSIEHGMVEALVSGDIAQLDKLGAQLKRIDRKPRPMLTLVSNLPLTRKSQSKGQ